MSDLATRTPEEIQTAESRAFALGALDAIAHVTTPEEAESLLARVKIAAEAARVMRLGKALSQEWRGIELKAERKWGELLGEAETGRPAGNVRATDVSPATGAEREAAREARKLAAVPGPVFAEYVQTAEAPTKAGLLRTTADPKESTAVLGPNTRVSRANRRTTASIDEALHKLDGMCAGLTDIDPTASSEEQITEWLATAERARSNLRRFTALLRRAA